MPNSVDTRIVEMEFDNARFERNVKQSIRTLQALDKQLQFTEGVKGFEEIEAASEKVTFEKMAKSLSFIEYRLSALGMTSAKIINKITDKIGGTFSKLESLSIGQIKSGGMARALKLEHASFMLDGILKDAEKVKDVMDNAVSPAVDGTAYGLDAAANAASQFVASGIQDIDKLKTALTGISGVAAMSGAEYEEIAHIFTKVAASGRMMGDTVVELSTRGINAQAELAKYLDVTVDKVQEMQKKGQISFETFANAMNDAFGEQAKKANDTYTGALSNLKAALSRVGADFATPYLNNMRDIFNALRVAINTGRKSLQPLVKLYTNIFNGLKDFTIELLNNEHVINIYMNVIKSLCRGIEILSQLLTPLRQGFLNAFPEGMVGVLDSVTSKILNFMYKLQFSKGFLKDMGDFIGGIFSALKLVAYVIEQITGVSTPLFSSANHFLGGIGSILGFIGRLVTALTNMVTSSSKANAILSTVGKTIRFIASIFLGLASRIISFIATAKELPIVKTMLSEIADVASGLAEFILPKLAYAAGAVVLGFQSLVNLVQSGIISKWFNNLCAKVDDFLNVAKSGGGVITSFTKLFKGGFKNFPGTIKASAKALDNFNNTVSDTIKPGGIFPTFKKISDSIKEAGGTISGVIDSIGKTIKKRIQDFGIARATIIGLSAGVMSLMFNISGVAKTVKNSFAGVPKLINAMTRSFDAVLYEAKSKALIIGLAVAIGALTVSLIALSMIKPERLKAAALAIIALVGAFTLAGLVANKLGGGFEGFKSVAFSFISFAGAMVLLCMALQEIASIELDTRALWMRIVMLGSIMVALGGVLTAMTWLAKPVKLVFGVAFLIGFAMSIKMLVQALAEVANLPLDKVNAALPALLKLMGGLALVSAACTMLSPLSGVGFFAIVASITGFILALIGLAEILDPEKFEYIHRLLVDIYNVTKTWLIIFSIAALVWSLKKGFEAVTKGIIAINGAINGVRTVATTMTATLVQPLTIAAQALKSIGSAMVIGALVAGFIAIATAIGVLGKMDDNQFMNGVYKAIAIASGLLLFLGGVMILQKFILGKKQFLAGLEKIGFSLAALIASLGFAMKALSGLTPDELNNGVVAIGEIMLIITAFEVVSAILAKDSKAMQMGVKTALALSALILAVTLAVGLLSMVSESTGWPNLIAASGAMLLIMTGLAAICWALGQIKTGPAIAATVGMTVLFVALAGCMYLLQDVDWVQAGWTMAIILGSVAVMASIMYLLGKNASDTAKGMALVVGISAVFAVLTAVATYVQQVNWEAFASNMGVMLLAVAAMAAVMYIIGGNDISDNVMVGLAAVAGISLVFGILTIIATQLQSLDWTGVLANLAVIEGAITLMGVIMYFIGSDKFFRAIAKGTAIAAGMGLVFEIFAHVATILQNVQWAPFLANLAIIEGGVAIMGVIMFGIGKFAKEVALGAVVTALMALVMWGLAEVAKVISTIDTEGFKNNIIALGLAVAGLAVVFGIIGVPAIAGFVALGAVVVGLMTLVLWGLSAVAKLVAALDGDAFGTNVEALAWGVAKLAVVFGIIGVPVIAGLVALGAVVVGGMALVMWGLAEVAKIIATIDTEGFNTAIDALIEGVTKFGIMMGILGAIVMTGGGAVILLAGAAALLVFAGVMYIFTGVAKSFAEAGVEVAAALELLAPAFEHVGQGLESFSKSDFGGIVENLAGLAGSVWVLGQMSTDTEKAAESLSSLAEASNSSHQNIALVEADMMTLSASTTLLSTAATTIKDAFTDIAAGAKDAVTALSSTDIYAVVTEFGNQFKTYSPAAMQSVGVKMVQDICDGFSVELPMSIPAIVTDLVNAFNDTIVNNHDQIFSAGAYMGATLVEGCRSAEGVDAHSNSWKFIEIGEDCIGGLVDTFFGNKDKVANAAKEIGKTVTDNTAESIKNGSSDVSNALKDMIKDTTYTGKKEVSKDENNLGKTMDEATTKGIEDNAGDVLSGLKSFLGGLLGEGQALLDSNPLVMSVMVDTHGLTEAQRLGAEAEDKKRSDTYGYNTLEELQKAGQRGDLAHKWSHKAVVKETAALKDNTSATKGNSSAKKANEKANDGKTKAIDEETESLEGEEEQTGETSEAIREMAEQIEVVTEEYNWLNHYIGLMTKTTGRLRRYQINSGKIWSGEYDGISDVTKKMKELIKAIPATVKASKRTVYSFTDDSNKMSRMFYIGSKKYFESAKGIYKFVLETGKNVAKVRGDLTRVYYQDGKKVNSIVMNSTKNLNKIPKAYKKAMNTIKMFSGDTEKMLSSYEWSDDVITHLRKIEDSFGKVNFGKLDDGIQNYLKGMRNRFKELDPAITQISRALGGTYNVFSSLNRTAPATMDALISLGAVLYNGSDAANEYATKIAQLEFLYEHGEISWEELQEAKIDYLTRIKDALLQYKQALEETYNTEIDMFKAFDKNALEEGTNILKTQASQIAGYYTYGEMLTELSRRIPNLPEGTQLVKQFADGGIENFGKLEAVLKLTNDELQAFIYGIGVLNKTQTELSNKAFAAVANATSYASKREQARTKDIATKTTKYSAKVRKDIESDMYAMAQATTEYNNLFKKEEKEYLKTLTKSEKKQYKKYKKELNYAKKKYNAQMKALTVEEKVAKIMEGITDYDSYLKALGTYANDVEALAIISEKFTKAFEPLANLGTGISYSYGTANDAMLAFASTLDSTGESGLNFFEEMEKRIENFRDQIKDTISSINILSEAFGKADKITLKDIYEKNILSQIGGYSEIAPKLSQLAAMGYNNGVIKMIKQMWDSNPANANAYMDALLSGNQDWIDRINASYEAIQKQGEDAADAWTKAMSSTSGMTKSQREQIINNQKQTLAGLTQAREALDAQLSAKQAEIDAKQQEIRQREIDEKKLADLAGMKKRTKKQEKEYKALIKKVYGSSKLLSALRIELSTLQSEYDAIAAKQSEALTAEFKKQQEIQKAENALIDYNLMMAAKIADIQKDAAVKKWFDTNITTAQKMIDSYRTLSSVSKEYLLIASSISAIKVGLGNIGAGAEAIYNLAENFQNIKKMIREKDLASTYLVNGLDNFTDGLLKFGQTLIDTTEDVEDFYEALKNGLEEYQKSLKSTISTSSDFFSEFKKYSDEDNPLKAKDYLKYGASQIQALTTWQENLKKLTDMGLNKELIEKFASQGLGSYEEVAAWVQASAEEIKEYNGQWLKYQAEVENATKTAMASIAASYSVAGETLADSMIKVFTDESYDRLKNTGENASGMIIEGIKDGLTNAMPTIVDKLTETDTANTIAGKIGVSVGTALNEGIVQAVANSVENTVNAAVEKFKMAVDTINAYVQASLNNDWTINVHVNTSEIDMAVARMNSAIYGINADAMTTNQAVSSSIANSQAATMQSYGAQTPATQEVNVNYTQNNYSPKALSRPEIYRQTRNQLSTIESAIAATTGG